jgi:hypothetical protein
MSKNLKQSFLDDHQVGLFINYLLALLDGSKRFEHQWTARGGEKKTGFNKGDKWQCSSLTEAFENYRWPAPSPAGNFVYTLNESNRILNYYRDNIVKILNDSKTRQEDARELQEDVLGVLRWGGVDTRPHIAKAMKSEPAQLKVNLNNAVNLINRSPSMSASEFLQGYARLDEQHIRIDSGTTKIYSLICDNFIILDSRVGAALCMLAKQFCAETGTPLQAISEELKFSWGAAYGESASVKIRNPNDDSSTVFQDFSRLSNHQRLLQNLKASWLLSYVIDKTNNPDFSRAHTAGGLRRLEAALFMIGYDVNYANRQSDFVNYQGHQMRDINTTSATIGSVA